MVLLDSSMGFATISVFKRRNHCPEAGRAIVDILHGVPLGQRFAEVLL